MSTTHLRVKFLLILLGLLTSFSSLAEMPVLRGIGGDFTMQSSRGKPITLSDFKQKVVLMFFGYTNCADICPTTMAHLTQLMHQFPESSRSQIQVLFVSLDSDYDTPKHLNKYLSYFDPSFIGLVDSREKIDSVADLFQVDYTKLAEQKVTTKYKKLSVEDAASEQNGYLYSHTAKIFVLDNKQRVRGFFYTGTPIDAMKQQVESLL
ncbi:SCO family protein [Vibrio sp.]|uniref:SCO family protein n=1 Tax=Vibrio sp. TaxID=678 RepID=UPI003D14ECA8